MIGGSTFKVLENQFSLVLVVQADLRGRGVGKALMRAAMARAVDIWGALEMYTHVEADNEVSSTENRCGCNELRSGCNKYRSGCSESSGVGACVIHKHIEKTATARSDVTAEASIRGINVMKWWRSAAW